jgi:hypothetical protein
METNPYQYDSYNKSVPWIPQQNQVYEGWYTPGRSSQQRSPVLQNSRPQQRIVDQKPKPAERMPKARALALVRTFKKWLVAASLVGFLSLSGLVASHQVGTSATSTSSGSSQATPTTPSSSQNSNGFFDQQGGNNFGSNNSSNGTSSSSNGFNSSSQAPVSGSSVS